MAKKNDTMEKLVSLAKRRGYVFPSSEIYGGFGSTWDYGPLGTELIRNIKEAWWRDVVLAHDNVVGINASILMSPEIWKASGHLEHFSDPLVECGNCRRRFRPDDLAKPDQCPVCGKKQLGEARQFNTMFKTFVGPVEDEAAVAYLRPETAQAIFVNFKSVQQASRARMPFGIAQIGKAFRNEITTGNFLFRTREFEQMEMEFFVEPGDDERWFDFWVKERVDWFHRYGIPEEKLQLRAHDPEELAHYSLGTTDIEYEFPFGWSEIEGIARRGDYDLRMHQEASGKDLTYFDQAANEHILPWVVEPSAGVDRAALAFLSQAYAEEEIESAKGEMETRVVLKLDPRLAPTKVAFFPLIKKEPLQEMAHRLQDESRFEWTTFYDEAGAIGRRYRRQDEAGTPFCVTVDFDSLEDDAVTVRDRDTLKQDRVAVAELTAYLREKLAWR
jgi:glycyl-tRNA synthetase